MERSKILVTISLFVCTLGVFVVDGEVKTYRSPAITLGPGDVEEKYFLDMEIPSGHVGLRSFYGELVDEEGKPVPLSEVYIHHWLVLKEHVQKGDNGLLRESRNVIVRNDGICQGQRMPHFFGSGSETRHTSFDIPAPYAIEIGNPEKIPFGYEEKWILNVHGIDIRGAVNPRFCLECRCEAYNISKTSSGLKVPEEYLGGLWCCQHNSHCAVKKGFHGEKRKLYFQYTLEFYPMEPPLSPVRVYIMDVTDDRTSLKETPRCKVEYDVEQCDKSKNTACLDEKKAIASFPEDKEVDIIYVTGHLHVGGVNIQLLHENDEEICKSESIYGTGHEAGNETGYVVGMTACYPEIGTQRITPGEEMHIKAVYDNEVEHTGVMGLVYVLVVDSVSNNHDRFSLWKTSGAVVVIAFAVGIIGFSLVRYVETKRKNTGYESLVEA